MHRRTIGPIAVIGVLALAFAACGGGGSSHGEGGGAGSTVPKLPACPLGALRAAPKPVEITYWHAMTRANEDALKKLTAQFNAQQHDVHVTLSASAAYTDNFTRFTAGLSTGVLPDLLQSADTGLQQMVDSGAVVPMASCLTADQANTSDLIPRVVAYFTVKGVLYGMPFNESNQVLYYDKAAFRRAGLDPNKPPATLDEVRADAEKLVRSRATRFGIALKNDVYFEHWMAHLGHPLVDNDNGRAGRATRAVFDDAAGVSLFAWVEDMVRSKLALNTGTSDLDNYLAVGDGKAAMTIDSSAALGTIAQVFASGQMKKVELGVGPMPKPPGATGGELVGGAANFVLNRSSPVKQAAAYEFAKFLSQPKSQSEWAAATGYVPVSRSAVAMPPIADLYARQPEYKVAYDELLAGSESPGTAGAVVGAYGARGQGMRGAIIDNTARMLAGELSPEAAVRRAVSEANAAIEDYNSRVGS